jgi:Domain of unknown function (DUF1707)
MSELELRVSDAEREAVAARLRQACVEGRLTLAEFSQRVEAAYAARTGVELEPLLADLPAASAMAAVRRRRARRFVIGIFGGPTLTGRWRAARRIFALCLFAGVDIDLRRAELSDPVVTIYALTLFGGSDVYVPKGVEVDMRGLALFGGNDEWGDEGELHPGAPLVRVVFLTLFGGADVRHVRGDTDASLRELIGESRRELPR